MTKSIPRVVRSHYQKSPQSHRSLMLEMRNRILSIVPEAEEVVSYGMPAFKVNGTVIAGLLANKDYVGYYPFSGSVLTLFEKDIRKYSHTKSALHVPLDNPLPKSLISKLIKARISLCPVQQGKVDLKHYETLDEFWRELGIAAPARRALVNAKIFRLADLKKVTELEFLKLHGMGPSAASQIKKAMKSKKIAFARSKKP